MLMEGLDMARRGTDSILVMIYSLYMDCM